MLVPLTSSLFVPGFMKGDSQLLVDIGTGYFVGAWVSALVRRRRNMHPARHLHGTGKSAASAIEAMQRKTALLKQNTDQLFKVINSRRENLEIVTDVLRRRVAEAET